MFAEVDVFISNYTIVDPDIYQLWIEGYSCMFSFICLSNNNNIIVQENIMKNIGYQFLFLATEAVTLLKQKGVAQLIGAPLELIASDVLDHYRTYSLLERLLSHPSKLSEQPSFQLEPHTRSLLIEK